MSCAQAPIYILLAAYDGERFLPALIESIKCQTDLNWVLLVRDDESTDGSARLLRAFAASDARVQLLSDPPGRLGICANFEWLLARAHAAGAVYFALCDQDDIWYPDKLARMRAALDAGQSIHGASTPLLAYADLALIDAVGRTIAGSHFESAGAGRVRRGVGNWLLVHNLIPGCAMTGNRALLELALPFPPRVFHHDWWLALVAAAAGQAIPVEAVLTGYRQHGGNAIGVVSPGRKALAFLLCLGPSLRRACLQYLHAVDQAGALVERLGASGHRDWIAAACVVRDRLGAPQRHRRVAAIVTGPVRRLGFARNVLMFVASMFASSPRGLAGVCDTVCDNELRR